ncbi:MAG TPA: hypothetical protein DHW82_02000 [Spirochaetia bacterium]|nr:MAG: hypothetical protein A2Y41_07680 [Spirochaetes bacterium GWB1_36_13]HCL55769.1 hypothetical protein [Spirochaetia bacterium]
MEIKLTPNLYEFLKINTEKNKNKPFLKFKGHKLSYQDFFEQILKLAAFFQSLKFEKNFKVGLLTQNRPEFITVYFASIISGANIIPINYFLNHEEIEYIVNNSGMKCFCFSKDFEKTALYLFEKKNEIKTFIAFDPTENQKFLNYASCIKEIPADSFHPVPILPEHTASIIYTSGTTGNPKGAMLSHENLISDAVYFCRHYFDHYKHHIRYIAFLPLFHSFSFMVGIICMMELGATVSLMESILPFDKVIKTMLKDRINILVGIPQVFRVLSEKKVPAIARPLLKLLFPIKSCISGGAPLGIEVLAEFEKKFRIPIHEGYGLTEASPIVSVNDKYHHKHGSVGRVPKGLMEIKIVDENRKTLPNGKEGEIALKGKNIMKGYFNNPEETEKVLQDGWLYTGDIGILDDEGFITIVDRKKNIIISNGMNIYPAEIETVLRKHPSIREAVVVGVPDKHHGETPFAVIELYPEKKASALELKQFLMKQEARYKIPKYYDFWNEIPRNQTGKILKREIRKTVLEKMKLKDKK